MSTGPHVIHWKLRTSATSAAASSAPPPAAASQWSTIQWEGANHLSTLELKRHLTQQLGLAASDAAFDFMLHNHNTGEEYKDDNFIVHRNTSVVARRINATRQRAQQLQVPPTTGLSAATTAAAQQTDNDDQQILALVNTASRSSRPYSSAPPTSYGPQQYQRASHGVRAEGSQQHQQYSANSKPPPSYVCHRCGQGGHFIRNCFPEHDTRILTSRGLLFLDEIERVQATGETVLYGCYDVASKELQYSEGELTILDTHELPTHLVEFTSGGESARWTEMSGRHGTSGVAEDSPNSRHVSLRVTPEHKMFVQKGNMRTDGKKVVWSSSRVDANKRAGFRGTLVQKPPKKRRAEQLLSTDPRAYVRMLACAQAGHAPQADTARRAVRRELQLTRAQFPAFVELLGFWLGDGSMDYRKNGSGHNAVSFRQVKKEDLRWLREMFHKVGLKASDWGFCMSGLTEALYIVEQAWFAFFDAEFGTKYKKSASYTPPSFTRSLSATPSSTSESRRSSLSSSSFRLEADEGNAAHDADAAMQEEEEREPMKHEEQLVTGERTDEDEDEVQLEVIGVTGAVDEMEDDEHSRSVKWLPAWAAELARDEMRLLIEGLRRAEGDSAEGGKNIIHTSGVHLRDQLMLALLHCGYSPYATLKYLKGTIQGYHKNHKIISVEEWKSLTKTQQCGYTSIEATADNWKVSWADMDSLSDQPGADSCMPSMSRQECIKRVEYNAERDKRVWCVTIAHHDQLIFAQRAERHDGVVTKQSRPIIVSNCPTNGDPAFDGRRPKAALAVQQYEQNAQKLFLRDVEDPKALERGRGEGAGGIGGGGMRGADGGDVRADDRYHTSAPPGAAAAAYATPSYDRDRERPVARVADVEARLALRPDLLCPIDHRVFVEPTVVPCCFASFCRECIERWLLTSNLCFRCKQPLDSADLRPNLGLQKKIQQEREGGGRPQHSYAGGPAAGMPPPARRPYEENGYEQSRRDNRRGYSAVEERARSPPPYDRRVDDRYDGRDRQGHQDDRDRGGRDADRDRDYRSRQDAYPPSGPSPREDRYPTRPPPQTYPPPSLPPPNPSSVPPQQRPYYPPPPPSNGRDLARPPYEQPPPPPGRYDNGRGGGGVPYDGYGRGGGYVGGGGYEDGGGRRY